MRPRGGTRSSSSSERADTEEPKKEPLRAKVHIRGEGSYSVSHAQAEAPTLIDVNADGEDHERWDYAKLSEAASQLASLDETETIIEVSADADVPMQTLISTLDAVRGPDCKLIDGRGSDGARPEGCWFIDPVVTTK